ncbi:MAG TPA: monovalent cation/H+ antiporter complex subunit F [Candidatus Acidoferrales bacterium]|nr:monovalent cation/H+ antiporter complex subunit F [Candidatus Acidoferrales bacterium]
MNLWLWAATAFLCLLLPVGVALTYGSPMQRLAALQLGTLGGTMALLLLAQGYGRTDFYDVAFTLALLSIVGSFAYAHVHERWL